MLMIAEVFGVCSFFFFFLISYEHQALDSRWQCEMGNLSLASDLV